MPRGRGPEEFFEVFREVQEGRKARDERPEGPPPRPSPRGAEPRDGALSLTYPALAGSAVVVVLLVAAGYLLGRQHGWRAALRSARRSQRPATPAGVAARPQGEPATPEMMEDGTIFTLLTLGRERKDRESVEAEAQYLNSYGPFLALGLRAYAWRDSSGKYRLCARGFRAMAPADRQRVRDQVRRLAARSGRREYRDADFLAP